MDFFAEQDQARKRSKWLVLLFCLAVIGIALSAFLVLSYLTKPSWNLFWLTGAGTLGVVVLASLGRIASLSSGGSVVAESLGGHLICPNTNDPQERRVHNIVEEMAIASGTPVPPVYLMEEKGINAFAAGYSANDAVVGITRGCVEKLNREQLQGVVAHEFSHILNGDMRLNIKLTGLIFGIVCLSRIGEVLMRVAALSGSGRRRKKDDGTMAILALGLTLFILGLIGGFFGSLIRAAVSRQREFLADASAVQFTRNPDGISGALKRIGGYSVGSKLETASASDFSHMFFGSALGSIFATHPPLEKRIKKIEPNWDSSFPETDQISEKVDLASEQTAGFAGGETRSTGAHTEPSLTQAFDGPSQENIKHARSLLAKIPSHLLNLSREPFGARCVIFALLLDPSNPTIRDKQIALIRNRLETDTDKLTNKIYTNTSSLSCFEKFALVEECASALHELSPRQLSDFSEVLDGLIAMDQQIDLFEWSMEKVIFNHLNFGKNQNPHGSSKVSQNLSECHCFIGALAHYGGESDQAKDSFTKGSQSLSPQNQASLPSVEDCGIAALENALIKIQKLSASEKRNFLTACMVTAEHDGAISENEYQILRGLAAAISCPLGPFIG